MGAGRVDVLQILFLLLVQLPEHAVHQDFGEADDSVQRRPQLVGHIRQELRLVLAGDFELATLVRDLLEQPHVLNRDDGLVREGRHELNLLVGVKARTSVRANVKAPMSVLSLSIGMPMMVR
jgi:hypothetical protein